MGADIPIITEPPTLTDGVGDRLAQRRRLVLVALKESAQASFARHSRLNRITLDITTLVPTRQVASTTPRASGRALNYGL